MKNLVVLFAVAFLFTLTSCSDVNDNSFLTNPIMEKTSSGITETPPNGYPYPYLYNFSEIKELKYTTLEGTNTTEFYMSESAFNYSQLYVVANYGDFITESAPKMFFINEIKDNSFRVIGLNLNQVKSLSVYGLKTSLIGENAVPFQNNASFNELGINKWRISDSNIAIGCTNELPFSIKFVFAELKSERGNFLVFLQKPISSKFEIPEYGKYGVHSVQLFGYQSVLEIENSKY
jgi:hypothetical protein